MSLREINESKDVTVNSINFTINVDTDPLRARFMAKTSKDLDKLATEADVDKAVKAITDQLKRATGISWSYDEADPGAGYSFIPNEQALARQIESSFQKAGS